MDSMFKNVVPTDEETIPTEVSGNWPDWLTGDLVRIGPGKWDLDQDFTVNHWFDGCAVLFKFAIDTDGSGSSSSSDPNPGKRITFQSKFPHTEAYNKMTACCRPVYTEFGTRSFPDPSRNVFARMINKLVPTDLTDNVVGNLFCLDGRMFAVSETAYSWRVDPSNLAAQERVDMHKFMWANLFCPHPVFDPSDGSFWNIGTSFMTGLKHHVVRIPALTSGQESGSINNNNNVAKPGSGNPFERAEHVATFPAVHKTAFSYFHSFGLTENFIVMIQSPLTINLTTLMTITIKGKALREAFEWTPSEMTKFVLIDKRTGRLVTMKFIADPLFILHTVNAYERDSTPGNGPGGPGNGSDGPGNGPGGPGNGPDDGSQSTGRELVIDVITYDNERIFDKFFITKLRAGEWDPSNEPNPRRFVIPLPRDPARLFQSTESVTLSAPVSISAPGLELPAINRSRLGRSYRYFYASGVFEKKVFKNAIAKVDLETGQALQWTANADQYPGEPVYVPRPGATDEDDGVVLVVVADLTPDNPSFLVAIDGRTMAELGRAAVPKNISVPITFHGQFLPRSSGN